MSSNIKKTKKSLSIAFTAIFFVVILSFWWLFFSLKYTKEITQEKNTFIMFVNSVEEWRFDINDMHTITQILEKKVFNRRWLNKNKPLNEKKLWDFSQKGFINFIQLDNQNKVILSNVKDNVEEDFISDIIYDNDFLALKQSEGFLVKKIFVKDKWILIFFKKLRYNTSDYFNDMLWFIFICFLFSATLYFIGRKFVDKAFIPVEENIADMKNFIHNAGHELKTPISVIDSNIQLMDDTKKYDKEMTKELKQEVIRLNSLIDSLVNLSDIDVFKDVKKIDLKESLEEVLNDLKYKIKEKKIKVEFSIPKDILIETNKNYLYMFLSNLLWNAIKYNKTRWRIDILYKNNELIIKDSWIWMKKAELNKIFNRFYKIDKSRNSEGFGIWLSLVKKISDTYNWKLKLESIEDKWTTISMKFN